MERKFWNGKTGRNELHLTQDEYDKQYNLWRVWGIETPGLRRSLSTPSKYETAAKDYERLVALIVAGRDVSTL